MLYIKSYFIKNLENDKEIIISLLKKLNEENDDVNLNINYIFNFFDILSKGDLFYAIKFFNIYFVTYI